MGALMFGNDESITCIQPVELKGPAGEELCLAYKTTKTFVGAGVWLRDDGYTLRVVQDRKSYIPVDASKLKQFQAEGLLPTPLPPYSIAWHEYLFGYSLWIVIAGMLVFWRLSEARKRRRKEEDAATPTSYGPPIIETEADRFVQEQVAPLLVQGERVQHQAYTLDRDVRDAGPLRAAKAGARFAVLTNQRLHLIKTRVGAFKIRLENQGVESIDRSGIRGVVVDDIFVILIAHGDGQVLPLFVPEDRKLSNQRAFLRDVPRILEEQLAKVRVA